MSYKIAMIGAGSGFTTAITKGLCRANELFKGSTFILHDVDRRRLDESVKINKDIVKKREGDINIQFTTDIKRALEGCDYVVTSCEKNRSEYWIKDIEIPKRYGIYQLMGENGGPGGQIHAMRNITMFMDICEEMRELCPDAWLMNFTNPMSYLCTYFHRYGGVRALGFCHQIHGSIGVVSEMLGFGPGDLEVITGGINHMNWIVDIRLRGTGESFMEEFKKRVLRNKYWKTNFPMIPEQTFTRDMLATFDVYPVGYDNHVCEYMPFFYDEEECIRLKYNDKLTALRKNVREAKKGKGPVTKAREEYSSKYPFPKDSNDPYYDEHPTKVMEAFETNKPLYMTGMVIPNHGAVENLPYDAIVDIPAVAVGGDVRGVKVGRLPELGAELCRRQIVIHEMVVEGTVTGDRNKILQAMALNPQITSIKQARQVTDAFLKYYKEDLPQFA